MVVVVVMVVVAVVVGWEYEFCYNFTILQTNPQVLCFFLNSCLSRKTKETPKCHKIVILRTYAYFE